RETRDLMKTLRLLLAGITALTLASNGSAISQPLSPADEKLGKVHFATSCAAGVAQEFDHAMALLHSFEFPAAITGFQTVLRADPTCGIAEWGIAMSTWGNPFGGLR